jgi:hypothetical protein
MDIAKQICHMAATSTPERAHVHHTGFITPDYWVALEKICTRTRQSLLGQINTELVMSSRGEKVLPPAWPGLLLPLSTPSIPRSTRNESSHSAISSEADSRSRIPRTNSTVVHTIPVSETLP